MHTLKFLADILHSKTANTGNIVKLQFEVKMDAGGNLQHVRHLSCSGLPPTRSRNTYPKCTWTATLVTDFRYDMNGVFGLVTRQVSF